MYRVFLSLLLSLTMAFPALAQGKKKGPTKSDKVTKATEKYKLYREITLEDFENTTFDQKDITYTSSPYQNAGIAVRSDFPAPVTNSKKYLGLKIFGKSGDALKLNPPKKLTIDKYCRSISMWVYGKNFSGVLSLFVTDANQRTHLLRVGKLNFLGWRKLVVTVPEIVAQKDKYLAQKRNIEIIKIMYQPANRGRLPLWNYFYIDDITADVREKYTDRQNDEW